MIVTRFGRSQAGGGGGATYKTVTVPEAKLGTTNVGSYTVTVAGTYSYLKSIANGGTLTGVNDVAFYDDTGMTSLRPFEREYHNLTTGEVIYHFLTSATLSASVDTIAGYMRLDEPGGDLSSASTSWRAAVKGRWGLGDGSSLVLTDSTSNGRTLTNVNATAAAGILKGGASFNGTTAYLTSATAAITTYPATFTCWAKSASSAEQVLLAVVKKSGLDEFWTSILFSTAKLRSVQQAAGNGVNLEHGLSSNNSAWHFYANVFEDIDNAFGYQDGVALGGTVHANSTPTGLTDTYIGAFHYNTSNLYQPMNGEISEPRIYAESLTASEIKLLYNNFNDPTTCAVLS